MKRKQILLGVVFSTLLLLCAPVLATASQNKTTLQENDEITVNSAKQKELLFQTILDLANNKEIQKIILNSEMQQSVFFNPSERFSVFTPHVLTQKYLNNAYNIGLILSKTLSTSKMHLILEQYKMNNQGTQKEINAVIEKDATLNGEITRLSNLKCDCENENTTRLWNFPVICSILFPIFIIFFICGLLSSFTFYPLVVISYIGLILHCFWYLG
jgi:hypothetical protein